MNLCPCHANSWLGNTELAVKTKRGHESQTAIKTLIKMHISNALYACPKNISMSIGSLFEKVVLWIRPQM